VHRSEATIPANVDHVLAIFLYHFSSMHGFAASLAWIGPFNSIKFNSMRRSDASVIIFHFNPKRRHHSIQFNVSFGL